MIKDKNHCNLLYNHCNHMVFQDNLTLTKKGGGEKKMKKLINILIIVAAVSFLFGLISRVMMTPFACGLVAKSFVQFTNTCLLFAITLMLLAKK